MNWTGPRSKWPYSTNLMQIINQKDFFPFVLDQNSVILVVSPKHSYRLTILYYPRIEGMHASWLISLKEISLFET